ncbi:MAG: HAD family hydrolase [Phycisphaerae bacterium]|nr:HAD family hydrolase [Phycisphaerae bacterium]
MAIDVLATDVRDTLMHWPAGRVQAVEVQRLLADFGIEISYQAYEAARAGVFALDAPKREIHGWTDFLALLFARMGVGVSVDLLTSISAMYDARDDMVLFPDAMEAIKAAKSAGLRVCAFTTLSPFMLGPNGGELKGLLDPFFNSSSIGLAKGDRRFYQRITEALGVEPDRILCVGDDPVGDCQVPREIGWRPVLLDRHGDHQGVQVGQVATITSLSDLSKYWDGLLPGPGP